MKLRNGGQNKIQSHLQFNQTGNNEALDQRQLGIKIEDKQIQNNVFQDKNKSTKKHSDDIIKEQNSQEETNKNDQSIQLFTKRQELFNQNPKLNYSSFEHIYKYFQDHEQLVQDLMQVADKDFIKKCMKVPPPYNDIDYQKFSELLLKILNETVEFTYVRIKKGPDGSNQADQNKSGKRVSKKQISRNKLNRYIHIFNKIDEKKVIKNLKLKKHIIALEKNQGIGEIDKKTLEHILNTFQYINYIKIKKIKIDIQTISQNIVRSIIIHKDVPEDDPRVIKAEKTINKGLLKKGPKLKDSDEDSDSDSDMISNSNFLSQSQQQQKQQNQLSQSQKYLGNKLQTTNKNGPQGKLTSGKQSDITSFLIKEKRNLEPNQKIYYYDEEDNENKERVKIEQDSQSQSQYQMQLKQALQNATRENCEIPAGPQRLKLLAQLIFQYMDQKLMQNYKDSFDKLADINYSQIYSTLYFNPDGVEFKYPLFQQNLCKNLLQLSSNNKRYNDLMEIETENIDINNSDIPSVDQILNDAFTSSTNSKQEKTISKEKTEINSIITPEKLISKSALNNDQIEQIKQNLGVLRGKEIKNNKSFIQDNVLKFKSYLIRYPCRKLVDAKIRYQMVDYFSFINQCVYNDSIKFFKINQDTGSYEKVKVQDINMQNIESIFYQITNNFYNHFNLSQKDILQ